MHVFQPLDFTANAGSGTFNSDAVPEWVGISDENVCDKNRCAKLELLNCVSAIVEYYLSNQSVRLVEVF